MKKPLGPCLEHKSSVCTICCLLLSFPNFSTSFTSHSCHPNCLPVKWILKHLTLVFHLRIEERKWIHPAHRDGILPRIIYQRSVVNLVIVGDSAAPAGVTLTPRQADHQACPSPASCTNSQPSEWEGDNLPDGLGLEPSAVGDTALLNRRHSPGPRV